MNKGLWIPKDTGCLPDEEMAYDNSSRIEPKRAHQWFTDGAEEELFPSKKQAVEVPTSSSFSGIPNSNLSPWGNISSFHSVPGQFTERLLESEAVRAIGFDDRIPASVSVGRSLNTGRKGIEDPFMNNSPFGLSVSHTLEDPTSGINFGGIRKVKVSEVRDPEKVMSIRLDPSCSRGDNNVVSAAHEYGKVDAAAVSMGLTYSRAEDAVISVGESYGMEGDSFISMALPYNEGEDSIISASGSFSKGDNVMAIGDSFSKGHENINSMSEAYAKSDANVISMGGGGYKKGNSSTTSMSHPNSNKDGDALSIGSSFNKGESNIISFGTFNYDDDGNATGRLIRNYDLLMGQPSIQSSETPNQRDMVVSNANALTTSTAQAVGSGGETTSIKKKEDQKALKKLPANNFPSNVRSLLSTGILDGVPVKYTAWSREKELRGVIKGSGYLCGCQTCNFSKVINAYEFERHASCKTKHPNNHIYFENGKTIYGIVQELRSTPQNMLFEVIQTITGSPINQKSFRIWKESFLAATRELQRIYGKDEEKT